MIYLDLAPMKLCVCDTVCVLLLRWYSTKIKNVCIYVSNVLTRVSDISVHIHILFLTHTHPQNTAAAACSISLKEFKRTLRKQWNAFVSFYTRWDKNCECHKICACVWDGGAEKKRKGKNSKASVIASTRRRNEGGWKKKMKPKSSGKKFPALMQCAMCRLGIY